MNKFKSLLIIFVIIAFSAYAQDSGNRIENLDASEFYIKMESNPASVVLDVRLFTEYKEERIPGALIAEEKSKLIPLTDTISHKTPILVYCNDGERSQTVCEILVEEQGFQKVYNLKRGLLEWKKRGLPMDKEKFQKKNIHRK